MQSRDSYSERDVVSAYEDKGLVLLEKKIFSKYLTKQNARILDIGCFVGRVSFPLAELGYNVFGLDTSHIAVKRASELTKEKKTENAHFIIASAARIPYKNESFDYVLFPYNTIEAVHSNKARTEAIREAARTLKKDGLVLFSVLNKFYPKNYIGIVKNMMHKYLFKLLHGAGMDKFFPSLEQDDKIEIRDLEPGSIVWVEPGGTKAIKVHFSTPQDIKKMLEKSSLKLVEKIPVMHHGPQRINADILESKYFSFIKAPVFYCICGKK